MELVARKPEPFDLQRERVNRGLSRLGLQQETGVHRDSIRRFEEGTVRPRAATAKKLADYFGVTAAELLGLDDELAGGRNQVVAQLEHAAGSTCEGS